jgi:hypothetical protein
MIYDFKEQQLLLTMFIDLGIKVFGNLVGCKFISDPSISRTVYLRALRAPRIGLL